MEEKDLILESWQILSQYIKDKQQAADHYINSLIDLGVDEQDLLELVEDKYLKHSIEDHGLLEDDYDEENLNFRKFSLVKPSDIDGTAYETFQSSNISLFATSSLPFKEGSFGSTSLDVPTNRTYSVVAVEVS